MFLFRYYLRELENRLWLRPAIFALIALLTPMAALLVQGILPLPSSLAIGATAVEDVLSVLATSLLAVTTFSVGTMVSAYAAASRDVTPRATRLLLADKTSQNVLATFIGVFLFSLVSIILLKTGIYNRDGQAILFVVTLVVVLVTVFTLISWVDFLARFGRVGNTIDRVEDSAASAIAAWRDTPALGGTPRDPDDRPPEDFRPVLVAEIGYVQTVDMKALAGLADRSGKPVYLDALPGKFVHDGRPVAYVHESMGDEECDHARDAFVIERERTYAQDPRFGVLVLAEIASRALSPGINDAGTAIEVIGRGVRVMSALPKLVEAERAEGESNKPSEPDYPRVLVPQLQVSDLFDDLFGPIARDGAGLFEVQARLQKAFLALAQTDPGLFGDEALRQSRRALAQSDATLALEEDRARIRHLVRQIEECATGDGDRIRTTATSP